MASLCHDKDGTKRVLLNPDEHGKRAKITLGKVSKRTAEDIHRRIEKLVECKSAGTSLDQSTAEWLASIDSRLHARLVKAGLAEVREVDVVPNPETDIVRLGSFLDAYVAGRQDVKPASLLAVGQAVRNAKAFFGTDRDLATISAGNVDDFKRWMLTHENLAPATVGKRLAYLAEFFRYAVRRELLNRNPCDGIKRPHAKNPARQHYVLVEIIEDVMASTADPQWRLLMALSRYLGVRVPSEPLSLEWSHVNFETGRIVLPSPKTERHGKGSRVVPILPEIRPHLDAVWDAAEPGTSYVFERLRGRVTIDRGYWQATNLRTHFERLIIRAGHRPWPKLWHNLRSSAETDLAQRFPIHVVCQWLGNSRAIAQDHYLQVTERDFQRACTPVEKPAQIPAQNQPELNGSALNSLGAKTKKAPEFPELSESCCSVTEQMIGAT